MKFLALAALAYTPVAFSFTMSPYATLRSPLNRVVGNLPEPRRKSLHLCTVDTSSSEEVTEKRDEQEWLTVLSAFELYKSAFGDLKVSETAQASLGDG